MGITRDVVVCIRQDAVSATVGDEIVLMNHKFDKYFRLDDIGADIWNRIQTPVLVSDLCAALAAGYEGEAATIERDVVDLLEKLLGRELIECHPANSPATA